MFILCSVIPVSLYWVDRGGDRSCVADRPIVPLLIPITRSQKATTAFIDSTYQLENWWQKHRDAWLQPCLRDIHFSVNSAPP